MMRVAYQQELKDLHRQFFQLGKLVNEAVHKASKAFVEHDKDLAKMVITEDQAINNLEQELEQECMELIALQHPITGDLRKIITILKASADFERMGDHAVSIAKQTIRVKGNKRDEQIEEKLSVMAEQVKRMGQDILEAYIDYDTEKAREIARRDEYVNELAIDLTENCITSMERSREVILGGTGYMLVTTYIERIGDYITNIAEWIVFYETGVIQELNGHQGITTQ